MSDRGEAVRKGGGLKVSEGVVLVEDECVFGVEEGDCFVVTRDLLTPVLLKRNLGLVAE